jgi:hypothetical protein
MKLDEFSVYYDVILTGGLNSEIVEFVKAFGLRFQVVLMSIAERMKSLRESSSQR